MNEIDINLFDGDGYMPLVSSDGWRVAIANSCERLLEKNISRAERHLETDEVFVLIKGSATLFIGDDRTRYDLEPCKTYNVKCGVWHTLAMGDNSSVLIIENDSTSEKNSEYKALNT